MTRRLTLAFLFTAAACTSGPPPAEPPKPQPSDTHVRSLADTFLAAYFDRYPETATQYGVPNSATA
jgi:hypothetical protein